MARRWQPDVLEYLTRREDPAKLLKFFQEVAEGMGSAFANANRAMPADLTDRPAVAARGGIRRVYMDREFSSAANRAGIAVVIGRTNPPTWSFPIVRIGAFSLTLGIVDRKYAGGKISLRSGGKYIRDLTERNEPLNPQGKFEDLTADARLMIPNGAFGGLIVAEPSLYEADSPRFVGLWVPAPI